MAYLLSLHLVAMICWYAGLFYLPRLFVYHAMSTTRETIDLFKVMEYKLYRYIMVPAMLVTILSGIALAHFYLLPHSLHSLTWFWIKLILVGFLIIFHFCCGYFVRMFQNDQNKYSHRFYRFFNEVPSILLILIIIMAIIRPF